MLERDGVLSLRVIDEENVVTSLDAFLTLQAESHDKVLYSVELLMKTRNKTYLSNMLPSNVDAFEVFHVGKLCAERGRKREKEEENERLWEYI